MPTSHDKIEYQQIQSDLRHTLNLVKPVLYSLGLAHRVDMTSSLINSGEHELAYTTLCENIREFDVPVSQEAYRLLVDLWSEIGADVRQMEGDNWHYIEYLGTRDGFPTERILPANLQNNQPDKR